MAKEKRTLSGDVPLMTTTLWDFRSQNYRGGKGRGRQGDPDYVGATPSYVIWNLLQRYTREKWLVVDPMCGSGTTLDVARDLDRRALGYDLEPTRDDIFRVDARKLPLETAKADFVFVDPPYSTHVKYSGRPECIGELDARKGDAYYRAMEQVIAEIHRVLKPERHMALYVCDSGKKGHPVEPIGFELFSILRRYFLCEDIVAVTRHNKSLKRQNWHDAAAEGTFFLRGFNYLFIMYKPKEGRPRKPRTGKPAEKKRGRAAAGARGAVEKKRSAKAEAGRGPTKKGRAGGSGGAGRGGKGRGGAGRGGGKGGGDKGGGRGGGRKS